MYCQLLDNINLLHFFLSIFVTVTLVLSFFRSCGLSYTGLRLSPAISSPPPHWILLLFVNIWHGRLLAYLLLARACMVRYNLGSLLVADDYGASNTAGNSNTAMTTGQSQKIGLEVQLQLQKMAESITANPLFLSACTTTLISSDVRRHRIQLTVSARFSICLFCRLRRFYCACQANMHG